LLRKGLLLTLSGDLFRISRNLSPFSLLSVFACTVQ
jgi:hypothetical protein